MDYHCKLISVHAPLEAPTNVIDSFYNVTIFNYQRSAKAAMVTVLDNTIGDIIDAIKNKYKLWDDLLLIFSTGLLIIILFIIS